jgi:hypothetical protein
MNFPTVDIEIGDRIFRYCKSYSFRSDWRELTDTGSIVIPGKFRTRTGTLTVGDTNVFRSGQLVKVASGYYPNSSVIFEGFVKSVRPGYETTIEVEDGAYLLKRWPIKKFWKSATLKTVVTDIMQLTAEAIQADASIDAEIKSSFLSGISRIGSGNVVDAGLGDFRVSNVTAAQILDQIKSTYGLTAYFRGFDFYVGFPYINALQSGRRGIRIETGDGKNWIADDLVYQRADEQQIKIVVKSLQSDNTVIEVERGDSNGDQRTIFVFGETDVKKLEKIGDDNVVAAKYEGYRGTITTFGRPAVRHGDRAEIFDYRFPDDRFGRYYIQAVESTGGVAGHRQIITLGAREL